MIDLRDYAKNYLDQYARGEFETVIARVRRDKIVAAARRVPHRTILEVGCGLEPLFPHLDDYDEYWTVDPLAEAVAAARAHPAASPRVHAVEGAFESVHEQLPSQFDFIAVSSLLHEVADPVRLLSAVRAHCGPESVVHINVPNVRSFHRLLAWEAGLIGDLFEKSEMEERFQRRTRFDRESLGSFVQENGFAILEEGSYFIKPFTHAQMESMLAAGIIDLCIIEALDRMIRYLPGLGAEIFVHVRRAE